MPAPKKSRSKSDTNVKWSPEAEVFLLEWLDKNKGAEGTLLQDEETALGKLITDEDFLKHLPVMKNLSEVDRSAKVNAKFQWFWKQYRLSPKYDKTPYTKTTIYTKGVEVLNWEDLGDRYIDLYTPEQIEARRSLATTNTSARQITRKRHHPDNRDQDEEAGNGQSPKRRLRSYATHSQNEVPSTSETSPQDADGSAHRASSQAREDGPILPARQPPMGREERRVRQNAMLSELQSDDMTKYRRLAMDERSRVVAAGNIQSEMEKLYNLMKTAVKDYMDSYDLNTSNPVILEPTFAYPAKLNNLLKKSLGGPAGGANARRMLFQKLQQGEAIGYGSLIRSLLAAAITEWCLEATVNEEEIYRSYGAGVVQATFESTLDPAVEMRLRQKLLETHVERNLKPRIRSQADVMAYRFQGFVDLLLPNSGEPKILKETDDVLSCPWTDLGHPDTTNVPGQYFHEGEARVNF